MGELHEVVLVLEFVGNIDDVAHWVPIKQVDVNISRCTNGDHLLVWNEDLFVCSEELFGGAMEVYTSASAPIQSNVPILSCNS